jgi:hypothetical protein
MIYDIRDGPSSSNSCPTNKNIAFDAANDQKKMGSNIGLSEVSYNAITSSSLLAIYEKNVGSLIRSLTPWLSVNITL